MESDKHRILYNIKNLLFQWERPIRQGITIITIILTIYILYYIIVIMKNDENNIIENITDKKYIFSSKNNSETGSTADLVDQINNDKLSLSDIAKADTKKLANLDEKTLTKLVNQTQKKIQEQKPEEPAVPPVNASESENFISSPV